MHDLTLLVAIVVIVLLAYQAEVDDRPGVDDDDWADGDKAERK